MNGNITKEGITADLEAMKKIGLAGATIVNVDCGIPHGPVGFMSPEWRDDFKFAIAEANRLGLELTVENCAGWSSSGGPWNTPENAMQQVVSSELSLTGPTNFSSALPSPPTKLSFYRDIAVLAYPVSDAASVSMKDVSPVASASSDSVSAAKILDGDDQTFVTLPSPKPDKPQFVQFEFAKLFAARIVKIVGGPGMPECNGEVQVSNDGKSFRAVQEFAFGRRNFGPCVATLGSEPVKGRFWRMVFYFVSNQRHETDSVHCTFRVSGKTPELWHPDTGVIERASVWHEQDGRTIVDLNFDPAGSVFVVFRSAASGNQIVTAKANAKWQTVSGANGELLVKATSDGTATFTTAEGKTLQATAANIPVPWEISGPWILSFPPNWGAPPSVTLDKLISWPDHPDKGVKYFSGTASYEKKIDVPAGSLQPGRELWLDLGAVKNFAEVFLNDQNLGILWKPPFRANLTPAVKPGVNKLVVKVTNLWPNRLIGDEQLPPDVEWKGKQIKEWPQWFLDGKPSPTGRLTFTTWHHWMKDSPLLESGLLGPVTLQTAQTIVAAQPDRKSQL
jgi:hypothetical protein